MGQDILTSKLPISLSKIWNFIAFFNEIQTFVKAMKS